MKKTLIAIVSLCGSGAFAADPTGCPPFEIELPRATGGAIVNAADFGLSSTTSNNAAAINRALAECRRVGASRLVLPKGVWFCHDATGVKIDGLEDFTFDGGGSMLVFYRPPKFKVGVRWGDGACTSSIIISGCRRTVVENLFVDWNWDVEPLATWARISAVRKPEGDGDESWVDLDLVDYVRHPVYPCPLPVQTVSTWDESRNFSARGPVSFYGSSEGHGGTRTEWLSPNRLRLWPYKRPVGLPVAEEYANRYDVGFRIANFMRSARIGTLLRLSTAYYGKDVFAMFGNEHLTLRNVSVLSGRGMGFHVDGPQHHWQFVDVNVLPPHKLGVESATGREVKNRPVTTTADVLHVSNSKGWCKFMRCRFSKGQDDIINLHDRAIQAKRTGQRMMTTTSARGLGYFAPSVGDSLEFLMCDFARTGFTAKITSIDGNDMAFDREVPVEFDHGAVLFDLERGTSNILIKDNLHEDGIGRVCIQGSNVTIEDSTFRRGTSMALKIQSSTTHDKWSEGYGCTNIVVRNCTFENYQLGRDKRMYGVYADVFIGANFASETDTLPDPIGDPSIFGDILFDRCRFLGCRHNAVHVHSAHDVVLRDCKFKTPGSRVVTTGLATGIMEE